MDRWASLLWLMGLACLVMAFAASASDVHFVQNLNATSGATFKQQGTANRALQAGNAVVITGHSGQAEQTFYSTGGNVTLVQDSVSGSTQAINFLGNTP